MAFAEDLTVFFDTDEFAVTATPSSGSAFSVIFDRAQVVALGGDISGTEPVGLARSADVSSLTLKSSTLTISGTQYRLIDKEPDGTGLTLLRLEVV